MNLDARGVGAQALALALAQALSPEAGSQYPPHSGPGLLMPCSPPTTRTTPPMPSLAVPWKPPIRGCMF